MGLQDDGLVTPIDADRTNRQSLFLSTGESHQGCKVASTVSNWILVKMRMTRKRLEARCRH